MPKFTVTSEQNNMRLDKILVSFLPDRSRSFIAKLIEEGNCRVNDKGAKASLKVKSGDIIDIDIPEDKPLDVKAEDIPLDIVYEDEDILVINKQQGLVVHPSNGHWEHTLVNAILHHCTDLSGINGIIRPGIVHRIDKDTSGLICVAKNDNAHRFLAEQLKDHTMARDYIALVRGVIQENNGTIDMPIGRDRNNRQKMAVTKENSKDAITHFKVLQRFSNNTLIECKLVTGRTHQIRVHMSYIGYPVEGDPLYGSRTYDKLYKDGQLLTAYKLRLIHPKTKKEMEFTIPIPDYFQKVLDELK
ncbi:MAG: RluA family pseudouridine synthase [Bacilli bacterium]|nr:RluA family pseudouridine synthase [Bacilli bacterium]